MVLVDRRLVQQGILHVSRRVAVVAWESLLFFVTQTRYHKLGCQLPCGNNENTCLSPARTRTGFFFFFFLSNHPFLSSVIIKSRHQLPSSSLQSSSFMIALTIIIAIIITDHHHIIIMHDTHTTATHATSVSCGTDSLHQSRPQ